MSRRIRAVEHRKCTAGLSDAHPGLQDRILLNYTRIENAHKVRKKTFDFLLCIEVQQIFFPFFPAGTLSKAWMLLCWQLLFLSSCNSSIILQQFFFKENVRYPVWTCRDPIYLVLGTRFSLILGSRFYILGTRIWSLKHLKKPCATETGNVPNAVSACADQP